jgi:hypothetical protein
MKTRLILLSAFVAAAGVSCGGNSPPPENPAAARQQLTPAGQTPAGPTAAPTRARSPDAPATPGQDLPNIPRDARWTAFCTALGGPNHAGQARELRSRLIATTGMRDFYVVSSAEQSTIYYGFYKAIEESQDRREAQRAQADRKRLAAMLDPATGARIFRAVLLVSLEEPDPAAPAEWDLARAEGFWSLQVGIYKDSPERKLMAVEAVREARAQGIDAYYYHGPTTSSVCIGIWPREAAERESERRQRLNQQRALMGQPIELEKRDPNAVLMVAPHSLSIPAGATTTDGTPIEVVRDPLLINDPGLEAMMRKFPLQALNGVEVRRVKNTQTGVVREVRTPSALVRIPQQDSRPVAATPPPVVNPIRPPDPAVVQQPAPPPNPWAPAGRTTQQGGKLKRLED